MRFGLLGSLVATSDDGAPVDLGQPRQRSVLALLLLEVNRVVSAERLVEDVWGDRPPARPAGAIHAYVSNLRRLTEPERPPRAPATIIVSQSPGYLLRAEQDDVDSLVFERLASDGHRLLNVDAPAAVAVLDEALALWRGVLLADFPGAPWAVSPAARLEELRASVLEDRFGALLSAGRHVEVTADLREAVERDPLRERLWELLIVALYRCGRQAEALAAYQQVRHHLNDELGIDPGRSLATLEAQVLEHAPELDVIGGGGARSHEPIPSHLSSPPGEGPVARELFGRDDELAALGTVTAKLHRGGSVIVISGAAGVGKTRLAEVALGRGSDADAGLRVAWGRCVDGDIAPPLWPWLQVASALGLDGSVLLDALHAGPAPGGTDKVGARAAMYERAVDALVENAREAPLAVVIDDAQWAGATSHHILQLLLTRVQDVPLLVVLTVRDGSPTQELAATLSAVARTRTSTRIELDGLASDAIAAYVEDRLGLSASDDVLALLEQRTGGNPFFLVELVRTAGVGSRMVDRNAFAESVPRSVREVIDRRVSALPARAGPLLVVAAVAGRTFDWRVVAAAGQQAAGDALEALDAAAVSGLIEEGTTPTRYHFTHDLIRECLYDELSTARRTRIHAAVAATVAELYGDDRGHANEIAAHTWLGRGAMAAADVVGRLLAAAEVTAASLGHEETELLLRRALAIMSDVAPGADRDRLERIATARLARMLPDAHASSTDEATSLLGRARELMGHSDDVSDLPVVLNETGIQAVQRGDWIGATAVAAEIRATADATDDVAARCNASSLQALIALSRGHVTAAVARYEEAAELARACKPEELIGQFRSDLGPMILAAHAFALALAGDARAPNARDEALVLAERADVGGREFTLLWAAWQGVVDDDASTTLDLVERCGGEVHMARAAGRLDVAKGWAIGARGDIDSGLDRLLQGKRTLAAVPSVQHAVSALALESDLLLMMGRPDDALERLMEGIAFHDRTGAGLWLPELHRLHGEAIIALGEPVDGALAAFDEARAIALDQGALAFARRAEASAAAVVSRR